jgi:hypothetical protein
VIARDAWFLGVLAYIAAIVGGLLVLANKPATVVDPAADTIAA